MKVMENKSELLTPVKTIRKSAIVAEKIKSLILNSGYRPGDKLPSENKLAGTLSVSRATVREGFHALELVGLVEVRPGSGTFVKNTNIFSVLGFSKSSLTVLLASEDFTMLEILEARRLIEISVAELVSTNCEPEDLAILKESVLEMGKSLRSEIGFKSADVKFHREMSRLTKNRFIEVLANSMYQLFWERFSANHRVYSTNPKLAKQIFHLHSKILESLEQKNPMKAKMYMSKHMNIAYKISKAYLEEVEKG
ncbi:MAG: FadR family transcriptional regulator [Deltaproteobacteria bacterium]|nr:FadR family transcriptional regulator [Deltaproteobacteria bacterium]